MTGTNTKLELAEGFVRDTGINIFLTGKAGTGKTTFLHSIRKKSSKRMIVVAPTGVAAINAGGVTIHSFFQLPFGPIVPGQAANRKTSGEERPQFIRRFSKEKINIIKSLDLLIIDEISMVRADLLDGIDETLRRFRDRQKAFGGVQLLLIGDLQQLAPVVKHDEWEILHEYYETPFFFGSKALQKTEYLTILLEKIYRQSDQAFIDILNKVRTNQADKETIARLNQRYVPGFIEQENEGYIILATHNRQAGSINRKRLDKLESESKTLYGSVEGDFPEYSYPTEIELELKAGAQVMFIKNDPSPDKEYFNGKIGIVEEIEEDEIWIRCEGEDHVIALTRHSWENVKYEIDRKSGEIREEITGIFTQFPLKLAWAITIHKSQGLTFDKAIIDARASFAHGQVYVALSRCRSLEGMILNSPLREDSFINNDSVEGFTRYAENHQPGKEVLENARRIYERDLIKDLFDFNNIQYHLRVYTSRYKDLRKSISMEESDKLDALAGSVAEEVLSVSEKFKKQIDNLSRNKQLFTENKDLNDRVQKANAYFNEKISALLKNLLEHKIETDNKEVKKQLRKLYEELLRQVQLKSYCLEKTTDGFSVKKYLDARAKAELEPPIIQKKKDIAFPDSSKSMENPELYAELVKWRNRIAETQSLPHYMVIHIKTLINIANYLPLSMKELKKVKGMGSKGIEKYGIEILKIVSEYSGQDIDFNEEPEDLPEKKSRAGKKKKTDTRIISRDMFRAGKSISEIARERDLTENTIENHFSRMILEGKMEVSELMNPDQIKEISEFFSNAEDKSLNPAMEFFHNKYSYAELRYVAKHLDFIASGLPEKT